ncbi:MAG: PH domain-containing protein [Streptosporangiales bacterium]
MSEGAEEAPSPVVEPSRLSPRSLLVDPVKRLGTILLPLAIAFFLSGHLTLDRAALYGLIAVGLSVAISMIRWLTFRYSIYDNRLAINSGLLSRRARSIPLDRIRGVDLTASPLHRMMGIVVVRVDAAAGGTGRDDEGVLDAVSVEQGRRLRQLLARRAGVAATGEPAGSPGAELAASAPPAAPVIARVRPAWFFLTPLTGAYLLAPLALVGTVWGWVSQSNAFDESEVEGAAGWLAAAPWVLATILLVFVIVAMPVASVGMSALLNWNFTVRDGTDALEIERGLLTRRHVTLERRRLRGWEMVEALPARAVRVARLRALVTGLGGDSQQSRAELLPVAPVPEVNRLAGVTVGAQPSPLHRHPRAALRRRLIRAIVPWLVLGGLAFLAGLPQAGVPLLLLAVLGVPLGIDRYRSLGHGYDGSRVCVRERSWSRRTVTVQRGAVVGWQLRQSVFQRRQDLATLTVGVGAGTGGYAAVDMDAGDAVAFAARITPRWVRPLLAEPLESGQ